MRADTPADDRAPSPPMPYGLEEEIDLVEYVAAVGRAKYWILALALALGLAGLGLGKSMTDQYESFVHLALRQPEDTGGVSPDNRRAPEVLTLVEHDFVLGTVNDNYRYIVMARLRSRQFTTHFIETEQVLPEFYPEYWDAAAGRWKDGFQPDPGEVFKVFHDQVRTVNYNPENELLAVHIKWREPRVAARWANAYVRSFNEYMRRRAVEAVTRKMDFLKQELRKTTSVELQKSIYRLLEAQTAMAMLAQAQEGFVLEVLDPAVPAAERSSPSLKRLALGGFAAGLGLGIALAIGAVVVRKLRKAMDAFQARGT